MPSCPGTSRVTNCDCLSSTIGCWPLSSDVMCDGGVDALLAPAPSNQCKASYAGMPANNLAGGCKDSNPTFNLAAGSTAIITLDEEGNQCGT